MFIMFSEMKSAIEKAYVAEDHSFFISKCKRKFDFMDKLLEISRVHYENVNMRDDVGEPSAEVYFDLNDFVQGEFKVKYTSVLLISKICEVFSLQHEFAVDNVDPSRMGSVLDGFGDQSYTRQQYDLDNLITDFLQSKNYKRLKYTEMEEVIPAVDMPKDSIFGSQMTVANALFRDVWNICPES